MYEQFGARIDSESRTANFRFFLPDGSRCPEQVRIGGAPKIDSIGVVGDFQGWNFDAPIPMTRSDFVDPADGKLKGWVYEAAVHELEIGFHQYKYVIEFENTERRIVSDPCARYGGTENQNSAFVVGGKRRPVASLKDLRRPLEDLVVYELMIDDFAACIDAPDECPMQRIRRRLDELRRLGVDAIEFMPWTTNMRSDIPGPAGFSWGYDPIQYFSVDHRYTNDPVDECRKLAHVRELVDACHEAGMQVILDVVCNHADAADPNRGFPYYWAYEDPNDCPYVGDFAAHAFYRDLEYANRCTLEYIRDSLIYWIEEFAVDGFRFDNTLGLYDPADPKDGLPTLLNELRVWLEDHGERNFAMILEHSWDYDAIDVVNRIGATACWLDPFRSLTRNYLGASSIEPPILRMLDSARDFEEGRCPVVYIENHDHRRLLRVVGGRSNWFRSQPAIIGLFTCFGAPMLYNGQEYGQDDDMPEEGDGRVVPRPLDWEWLGTEPGPTIYERTREMIAIRKAHPSLRGRNFDPGVWQNEWNALNEQGLGIDRHRQVVVYQRWDATERIVVVLNFGQEPAHLSIAVPHGDPWTDLLSGSVAEVANGRIEAEIGSNWGALFWSPQP